MLLTEGPSNEINDHNLGKSSTLSSSEVPYFSSGDAASIKASCAACAVTIHNDDARV